MLTRCAREHNGGKGCSKYKTYDQFVLIGQRHAADNVFVIRIKSTIVYEHQCELELSDKEDQDILKDEIILISSNKAVEKKVDPNTLTTCPCVQRR